MGGGGERGVVNVFSELFTMTMTIHPHPLVTTTTTITTTNRQSIVSKNITKTTTYRYCDCDRTCWVTTCLAATYPFSQDFPLQGRPKRGEGLVFFFFGGGGGSFFILFETWSLLMGSGEGGYLVLLVFDLYIYIYRLYLTTVQYSTV